MPAREITPAILPVHLEPEMVKNLPIDQPRYTNPSFLAVRDDTNELFLYKSDQFERRSDKPTRLLGKIGIMRTLVFDNPSGTSTDYEIGYVVDLRFIISGNDFEIAPPVDMPSDQEEANEWEEEMRELIPVAAIVFYEEDSRKTTTVSGDPRFTQAALHLAQLTDQIDARQQTQQPQRSRRRGTSRTQQRPNNQ